jgi:hypothetical protein
MLPAASKSLSLPFIIGANLRHEKEFSHTTHPLMEVLSANYSLVMCFCAAARFLTHSIDPSRAQTQHTRIYLYRTKKKRAGERDRVGIHKKILFWEPKAHSPFQARCLNYSSIRRRDEQIY